MNWWQEKQLTWQTIKVSRVRIIPIIKLIKYIPIGSGQFWCTSLTFLATKVRKVCNRKWINESDY